MGQPAAATQKAVCKLNWPLVCDVVNNFCPKGIKSLNNDHMSHEAATWLNRIGLVLGFFSFWFAAPEFIGEARLKSWESSLSEYAMILPLLFKLFSPIAAFSIIVIYVYTIARLGMAKEAGRYPFLAFGAFVSSTILCGGAYFLSKKCWIPVYRVTLYIVAFFANDQKQRQRSLFIGAGLFIISTILEFLATFESAK